MPLSKLVLTAVRPLFSGQLMPLHPLPAPSASEDAISSDEKKEKKKEKGKETKKAAELLKVARQERTLGMILSDAAMDFVRSVRVLNHTSSRASLGRNGSLLRECRSAFCSNSRICPGLQDGRSRAALVTLAGRQVELQLGVTVCMTQL